MASSPAGAASGRSAAGVIQTAPPAKRLEPVASSATPAAVPAGKTSAPATQAIAATVKPSVPAPTASKPAVTSKPTAPAALTAGYYINVGLFAEDANARKAHAKLIEAGLRAFVEDVKYPRGLRHRVRVGPFETEALANSAADKIHGLDLEAVVFQQK